jgi:NADPH:quinone reductase-like Zn-dependent oxidoreductase
LKQAQIDYKKGFIRVENVPSPQCGDNGILVKTAFSLISVGTEKSTLDVARSNYYQMAKKRPELKKKVLESMKKNGVIPTLKAVMNQLDLPDKLGYSCAGYVIEKGENVNTVDIGDKVACAGVGFASHSEINYLPKNLFVQVPDQVDLADACYVAVGAIALQSVRNAKVTLGERIGVIGLGLVGLITVQLLKSAGCQVIGFDIKDEKVELSKKIGIEKAVNVSNTNIQSVSEEFTKGYGLDAVIITASTQSNQPMIDAGNICKDKGRVVVVGVIETSFPRSIYYEKELELIEIQNLPRSGMKNSSELSFLSKSILGCLNGYI